MRRNKKNTDKAPVTQCQYSSKVELSETYFKNMQKWIDELVPSLNISDIETMRELLNIYDWLDFQKIKKHDENTRKIHRT